MSPDIDFGCGTWEDARSVMRSKIQEHDTAIHSVSQTTNEIQINLARIEAAGKASVFWAKAVFGLLTLMTAAASCYFVSLERRGKTSLITPAIKSFLDGDAVFSSNAVRHLDSGAFPRYATGAYEDDLATKLKFSEKH